MLRKGRKAARGACVGLNMYVCIGFTARATVPALAVWDLSLALAACIVTFDLRQMARGRNSRRVRAHLALRFSLHLLCPIYDKSAKALCR